MTEQEAAYNDPDFYVRTSPDLTRLGETLAAKVGAAAPEFEVNLLDGGTFRLADARDQRHVVLMMGAITSPMTAIQLPAMNALWTEFGPRGVDFYLVYVKESHPGENFPHHTSMDQKMAYARQLQELEKPAFPILVDSLDGHIHRSYGQWPTSLFVVHKDGRLVFRSTICQPVQLRTYLQELLEWEELSRAHPDHVSHTGYTEFVVEHDVNEAEHYRVYRRAGAKAFEDFWKVYPNQRDKWPKPSA